MKASSSRSSASALLLLMLCAFALSAASAADKTAVRHVPVEPSSDERPEVSARSEQPATPSASAKATSGNDDDVASPKGAKPILDAVQSVFDDMWDPSWFPVAATRGRYPSRTLFGDVLSNMVSAGPFRTTGGVPMSLRFVDDGASLRPIAEDDKAIVLAMKLAGVPRESVAISVDAEGLLTVDAKHKEKTANEEHDFSHHSQRQLPFGVDASKVSAEYKDGLLKITVPKPSAEDVTRVTIV